MQYIIFGTGKYYHNRKEQIKIYDPNSEILVFFDNAVDGDKEMEGRKVIKPSFIESERYDKMLLMSVKEQEMKEQLQSLGFVQDKIWTWKDFIGYFRLGLFIGSSRRQSYRRRILLITTEMSYNGGTLALVYAAKALARDNEVLIAAPGIVDMLVRELVNNGLNILVCPSLPYVGVREEYIIRGFNAVIVNVFQMLPAAFQIASFQPVVWWIHEYKELYEEIMSKYGYMVDDSVMDNIYAYAVSDIPRGYFNRIFPDKIKKTLPYGIPDWQEKQPVLRTRRKKVFALMGGIQERKGTDIYAQAAGKLRTRWATEQAEFWIVGGTGNQDTIDWIQRLSENSIELKGLMTREQIQAAYEEIDVVVCPSREDPLPIVMTEGMMYGKVCIASDRTGTAGLIREKENGLVCRAEDVDSLVDAMEWVLTHPEECVEIGRKARETYESIFTMDAFRERLEDAIEETLESDGGRIHEI